MLTDLRVYMLNAGLECKKKMTEEKDELPRSAWSHKMHRSPERPEDDWARCGIVMALYVYRSKKWLKIGEYCQGCGAIHIFKKFRKGIDLRF